MKNPNEIQSNQFEPYRFFKFRDIDKYSVDSLIKGTIYFSPINKLNDPFDCKLDIMKSIENAAKYLSKQNSTKASAKLLDLLKNNSFFEELQIKLTNVGICSFSLKLNEALLWSHYANKHKGIAILYEFPKEILANGNKFLGTSGVSYKLNPLKDFYISISDQLPVHDIILSIELAKRIFTAKSPCWRYEREVRIIKNNPGILRIEKSFIKQICFGLNTSDEDIELIKEIISHYKDKVQLCKAIRAPSDFGMRFKKI
jgi:hypothetical protein